MRFYLWTLQNKWPENAISQGMSWLFCVFFMWPLTATMWQSLRMSFGMAFSLPWPAPCSHLVICLHLLWHFCTRTFASSVDSTGFLCITQMGAVVPKGLLYLPQLTLCLLLASITRGCSYLLAATKCTIAGQFSDSWLWYLGFSGFLVECFWACLGGESCAARASHCADLPPTNLALHLVFTACSSSVSLLQPLFLHCCTTSSPRHCLIWQWSCFFTYRSNYLSFFL